MKYFENASIVISKTTTKKIIYVSQDVGIDTNDGSFARPFKTIQAGINAANSIAAFYNQVIVEVTPSSGGNGYNENITLSQQGICLKTASSIYRDESVVIKGNLTVNLSGTSGGVNFVAASNNTYIKGFIITCNSGNTITFSGTSFQRLFLSQCYVDNTGTGSAIVLTNTGSSSGTLSTITVKDSDINNNSSTNPTIKHSAGRIFLSGPTYDIQNANTGPAITIDGATTPGGTFTADKATITGQVQVTDNTSVVSFTFCSVNSGSSASIVTPSSPNTGYVFLGSVGLTTTATNSITGSGIVVLSGLAKFSTGGDIISTVTQSLINGFPQGQTLFGAGSTAATNSLIVVKNGHVTSQQTTAPTSALQSAAGSTATRTLTRCTDTAGNISITLGGTGITTGAQLIVTFNKSYNNAPVVILTPTNSNATTVGFFVTSSSTTFTINFTTAGTTGNAYSFTYHIIET